jgi:cytochrome d ubiquinol oxidase subunit II
MFELWFGIVSLMLTLYVVLDGYDLGVGMLMQAADKSEQEVMVNSIGPFWDANETWLVLGVGLLLVAFPVAHGVVLGALYLPVVAMLIGLMLRGVAFELRVKAEGWHRELWNGLADAGPHVVVWDGADLHGTPVGAGVFFYVASIGTERFSGKLVRVQ